MLNEIYFINSKALARRLANNEITEKTALWHLMVQTIMLGGTTTVRLSIECGQQEAYSIPLTLLGMLITGLIIYRGLSSLFKLNSSIDGENFFIRYAALSLPSGIQVFIVMIILSSFFGLMIGSSDLFTDNEIPNVFLVLFGELINALMIFLFFRIMLNSYQEISIEKNRPVS